MTTHTDISDQLPVCPFCGSKPVKIITLNLYGCPMGHTQWLHPDAWSKRHEERKP